MIRLENDKFKLADLRLLDAFPYIYSKKILENIKKQIDKVIDYIVIKAINFMVTNLKPK